MRGRRSRLAAALLLIGCGGDAAMPAAMGAAGEPLPGITDAQRAAFAAGRAVFVRAFTPEEGLGPAFNEPRCSSCHDVPTLGGAGADPVRKVTRFADGACHLLGEEGGDILQTQVTPALRALGFTAEPVPRGATAIASILPPALYGAGLVDAIPEESIVALADPEDADGDGISGRTGLTADGRIGRFGWKAVFATVEDFVRNAFLQEMGLTTGDAQDERRIGSATVPDSADLVPDPEIDDDVVGRVTDYVRLLAPPAPEAVGGAARDTVRAGRRAFEEIGCASCHRPSLTTGRADVEALAHRDVPLYSDLLLHDMGPENASICSPGAAPSEWRTTPLMGLRLRHRFWHDGRAQSIDAALRAHGGEAARARDRFAALPPSRQAALLRFLGTL